VSTYPVMEEMGRVLRKVLTWPLLPSCEVPALDGHRIIAGSSAYARYRGEVAVAKSKIGCGEVNSLMPIYFQGFIVLEVRPPEVAPNEIRFYFAGKVQARIDVSELKKEST
jgi:hypothetical protein